MNNQVKTGMQPKLFNEQKWAEKCAELAAANAKIERLRDANANLETRLQDADERLMPHDMYLAHKAAWRAADDQKALEIEAAESRLTAAKAEIERLQRCSAIDQERIGVALAEIERLRVDLTVMAKAYDNASNQRDAALFTTLPNLESRLAAANGLLRRCRQAVSPVSLLGRDLDGFLAAQPAAPTCKGCGGALTVIADGFGEAFSCPRCDKPATTAELRAAQPAVPARTDECPSCNREYDRAVKASESRLAAASYWVEKWRAEENHQDSGDWYMSMVDKALSASNLAAQPAAPTRTEAEKRVLDACAAVGISTLLVDRATVSRPYGSWADVASAELARRELK